MSKLTLLTVGAFVLLLAACGGGSDGDGPAATAAPTASTPAAGACAPARAHDAGEFEQTITSGGLQRNYIVHVPPGYDGSEPVPLVFLLHGFALTGRIMLDYTLLGDVADREGFIIVAPNGTGDPQFWNAREDASGPDDVLFVDDLIDSLSADLCIHAERVFATGYSNGGGMSIRLACDRPERIRAVGVVASIFIECASDVPLLAFHGVQDPLVSFDGGEMFPSIREAAASWAEAMGCSPDPELVAISADIEQTVYNGCPAGDGLTQLYVVQSGGHTWPGGAEGIGEAALTTQEVSASELIWEFFANAP